MSCTFELWYLSISQSLSGGIPFRPAVPTATDLSTKKHNSINVIYIGSTNEWKAELDFQRKAINLASVSFSCNICSQVEIITISTNANMVSVEKRPRIQTVGDNQL